MFLWFLIIQWRPVWVFFIQGDTSALSIDRLPYITSYIGEDIIDFLVLAQQHGWSL